MAISSSSSSSTFAAALSSYFKAGFPRSTCLPLPPKKEIVFAQENNFFCWEKEKEQAAKNVQEMRKMGDGNTFAVESMETHHCLNRAPTYLGNCPYTEHCLINRRVYNTAQYFHMFLPFEIANLVIPPLAKKNSGRNWRFPKWTLKKPTSQEFLPYYKRPKRGKRPITPYIVVHFYPLLPLAVISFPRFFLLF